MENSEKMRYYAKAYLFIVVIIDIGPHGPRRAEKKERCDSNQMFTLP